MSFCPWYPLARADAHAPPVPGLFQVRIPRGLVRYPRGRSAMIHYGWGESLREAVAAFAAAHPGTEWLCRHAVDLSPREQHQGVEAAFAALVDGFVRRFGAPPRLPDGAGESAGNQGT